MKKIFWGTLAVLASLTLASCGQATSSDGGEIVPVAVGNAYPPFTYLDDNGEPTGYDVEVLKAVDEKLEDYSFEYNPYEFKTILTAIDSGQARLASHQFGINDEREQNYLYAGESFTEFDHFLVTPIDSDFNPSTLDDLVGKNVIVSNGTNYSTLLEEYNESHEEQINIQYIDLNIQVIVNELQSGNTDATFFSEIDFAKIEEQYPEQLKISEEPVYTSETYFIYNKQDTEIKEAVDSALAELKEEGVIDQLSQDLLKIES